MHDLFDILGLPTDALPSDIRRAYARRSRRLHPDFSEAAAASPVVSDRPVPAPAGDIAVDFLAVSSVLERIQTAFFADPV